MEIKTVIKDVIRNKFIRVPDIAQLPLSRFYMMLIGLYAKYNLVFFILKDEKRKLDALV